METLQLCYKNLVSLSYAITLIRRVVVRRASEVAKSGGSSLSAGNRVPAHKALGVQHPGANVWRDEVGCEGGKERRRGLAKVESMVWGLPNQSRQAFLNEPLKASLNRQGKLRLR